MEDLDIWKLHLYRANTKDPTEFELSLNRCHNDEQKEIVQLSQGIYYLNKKMYRLATECFLKCNKKDFALFLYLTIGNEECLLEFLLMNLKQISIEDDDTLMCLVCIWILNLYINQLNTTRVLNRKYRIDRKRCRFR